MTRHEVKSFIGTVEKIKQWHIDRNLIDGSTQKDQVMKLIQEVGELSDSVCKQQDIRDDVGDIMVILINIVERAGISLDECLDVAYDDIKDRKGKMVDGIFVKDEQKLDAGRKGLSQKTLQCKVNRRYRNYTGQNSVTNRLTGILSTETRLDFSQEVRCQELR